MAAARPRRTTADRVEWALGIASAVVVLALAGFLVREAVSGFGRLPDLHVELLPAGPDAAPGEVRFRVRNDGGQTATAVALALILRDDAGVPVGERRLVIDYLPGQSQTTGGFTVGGDAGGLRPELVVEGYLDP